jgi:anti-sigma-K factor RskA
MTFSKEELMAYADGELDEAKRQQIQDAINRDPEIAQRVASHRALKDSLRASFDPVLQESVPDRLIAIARSKARESQPDTRSNVVVLRGHRASVRSRPKWIALAASFILGALALQLGMRFFSAPIFTARGQILTSAALQQALSNQLANTQSTQASLTIGVSFLSKSGQYCRTFQLQSLAGLACNDAGSWKVQVLAHTSTPASEYRQAGSNMPPAIMQAVTDTIAGEPLDAKDEANARAQKWQHPK